MLKKIITSLKPDQPASSRKSFGSEDEISHDEESPEDINVTSNDKTENGDDNKKNQISMLIRVVIVIGLGYLAIDHFFLKGDLQNTIVNVPRKSRKPKTQLEKGVEKTPEKAVKEIITKTKPNVEVDTQPQAQSHEVEVAPPVENINIAKKQIEEVTPINNVEKPIDEPPIVKTVPKMGEVQPNEQVDKSLDTLIDSVDEKKKQAEEGLNKKSPKLEDKIVADDVYIAPPAYDQLGRGLVYNCKEKYWSCVDKLSYVNCNKNMKWNKGHEKPAECSVVNVYNSDEDCSVIQKYNISTSQPTAFCQ